jgi:hypothetical protein
VIAGAVIACSGSAKPDPVTGSGGSAGSAVATPPTGNASCDAAKPHVEELYRGEVKTAQLVADNTAMVMTDCTTDPARVATCAANAKTVAELEKTCLIPLDEEGTEGDRLKR